MHPARQDTISILESVAANQAVWNFFCFLQTKFNGHANIILNQAFCEYKDRGNV